MDTNRPEPKSEGRVAQPADEEIKKHGDQLEKQVRDAAGKPSDGEAEAEAAENQDASKNK